VNELELRLLISEILEEMDEVSRIESFKEAEILTSNEGIVLEIRNSEFQITIVKSK